MVFTIFWGEILDEQPYYVTIRVRSLPCVLPIRHRVVQSVWLKLCMIASHGTLSGGFSRLKLKTDEEVKEFPVPGSWRRRLQIIGTSMGIIGGSKLQPTKMSWATRSVVSQINGYEAEHLDDKQHESSRVHTGSVLFPSPICRFEQLHHNEVESEHESIT